MLSLVLAFIGGGLAEALVAYIAHHFHKQQPVKVEIVDPTLVPRALDQKERRALLTNDERRILELWEPEFRMARTVDNMAKLHGDIDALEAHLAEQEGQVRAMKPLDWKGRWEGTGQR